MKSHHLKFSQKFPKPVNELWDFFSSPLNLEKITPTTMAFNVTSTIDPEMKMYPGMIITYKVSPLLGIKLNWMTEITAVEDQQYFIDEQRFGPFRFWHHQHHFKAVDGGTEMTDILTYGLPLGFIGDIAHEFMVKKQLQETFRFREEKTKVMFGTL